MEIILILGLIIVILGLMILIKVLVFFALALQQAIKTNKQKLLHDLVKREDRLWEYSEKIGEKVMGSKVLNFYEYLSFLYLENIIDKEMTKKLFKPELIKNYDKFKKYIKPEFNNLKKLYGLFKQK